MESFCHPLRAGEQFGLGAGIAGLGRAGWCRSLVQVILHRDRTRSFSRPDDADYAEGIAGTTWARKRDCPNQSFARQ